MTEELQLRIGQYRSFPDDNAGIPPTVRITSPAEGGQVTQGTMLSVAADATDDLGVKKVNFFVNGQPAEYGEVLIPTARSRCAAGMGP